MTDDLNMPSALTALWTMARSSSLRPAEQLALLADFNRVLGLPLVTGRVQPSAGQRALLEQRALARARKQWDLADELRSQLRRQGLQVHDRPGGTGWYLTAAPPEPEP